MKNSEILAQFTRGGIYMLGEYRGAKAETVNYRDKVSGKPAKFSSHLHVVESGDETITFQDRVEEGVDTATLKPKFAKGTKIFVRVESVEKVQGFLRATGTMFAVEA